MTNVLFFSTAGFRVHGIRHMDASIRYLHLPLAAGRFDVNDNLPDMQPDSAVAYLFTRR